MPAGLSMLDNLAALKAQGKDLDPNEEEPLVAQWGQLVEVGGVVCTCTQFSKDGEYLTVGCSDGSIGIYNAEGKVMKRLGVVYESQSSSNKLSALLQDNGKGLPMVIKFNPRSNQMFRVAYSDGQVELFNAKSGSSTGALKKEAGREANACDYSPDGDKFAVGGKEQLPEGEPFHGIRIVDEGTNKPISELRGSSAAGGHSMKIQCLRFKDRGLLASASLDGTVKLWSVSGTDPVLSLPQHHAYPVEAPPSSEASFPVVGQSIDFRGNELLIGCNRALANLQIWDIRKLDAPVQLTDLRWNRVHQATGKGRGWSVAKARVRNSPNILSAQWLGDRIVAGGSGAASNEVKFFRNEQAAEDGPSEYAPYASFKAPAGVLGVHVSTKKGLMAIAAKNGKLYGVRLPEKRA